METFQTFQYQTVIIIAMETENTDSLTELDMYADDSTLEASAKTLNPGRTKKLVHMQQKLRNGVTQTQW